MKYIRVGTDKHVAPVVNEVKPSWHTVQFNGSFLHENIYRQSAGPEVDAAWEALGTDCEYCAPSSKSAANTYLKTAALSSQRAKLKKQGLDPTKFKSTIRMEVDFQQTSKDCTICIAW